MRGVVPLQERLDASGRGSIHVEPHSGDAAGCAWVVASATDESREFVVVGAILPSLERSIGGICIDPDLIAVIHPQLVRVIGIDVDSGGYRCVEGTGVHPPRSDADAVTNRLAVVIDSVVGDRRTRRIRDPRARRGSGTPWIREPDAPAPSPGARRPRTSAPTRGTGSRSSPDLLWLPSMHAGRW